MAGVDTVKGSRNGLSQFWSDKSLAITAEAYSESNSKNWKPTDSQLGLKFSESHIVLLPLANSLFATGNLITLFQLDPFDPSSPLNDKLLKLATITLPEDDLSINEIQVFDRWTPLFEDEEPMYITNCIGNLIKAINNKSAAKYLETNEKLMSLKSKETEVYTKVTRNGKQNRHQVVAGGGGWGPKADTIVVSPDAKIRKNDQIDFFMLTPEDKIKPLDLVESTFEFECSVPEASYGKLGYGEIDNGNVKHFSSFGCGSEGGFIYNDTNHKSPGERVTLN